MKLLPILLLMISTQVLAEEKPTGTNKIKQCNYIANIAKDTIKAAISGQAISVCGGDFPPFVVDQTGQHTKGISGDCQAGWPALGAGGGSSGLSTGADFQNKLHQHVRSYYRAVDQIKTKYGQVRPQDRVRLNNRVEQKLLECRKTAYTGQIGIE